MATIDIPRCIFCERIATELWFIDPLGDEDAICPECMDKYSGYEWAVYLKEDGDAVIAAASNRQFSDRYEAAFTGTYVACLSWESGHNPYADYPLKP